MHKDPQSNYNLITTVSYTVYSTLLRYEILYSPFLFSASVLSAFRKRAARNAPSSGVVTPTRLARAFNKPQFTDGRVAGPLFKCPCRVSLNRHLNSANACIGHVKHQIDGRSGRTNRWRVYGGLEIICRSDFSRGSYPRDVYFHRGNIYGTIHADLNEKQDKRGETSFRGKVHRLLTAHIVPVVEHPAT